MILVSLRKWLDLFLNRRPSPQHEQLVDGYGVVYWLRRRTNEEARTEYLDVIYRRRGAGCGGDSNVVKLSWHSRDQLHIDDICFAPQHRRAGLGSKLLCQVVLLAKRQGARSVQGNISQEDIDEWPGLLDWYQCRGFRIEPPMEDFAVYTIVLDLY